MRCSPPIAAAIVAAGLLALASGARADDDASVPFVFPTFGDAAPAAPPAPISIDAGVPVVTAADAGVPVATAADAGFFDDGGAMPTVDVVTGAGGEAVDAGLPGVDAGPTDAGPTDARPQTRPAVSVQGTVPQVARPGEVDESRKSSDRTGVLIKVIIGLSILFILAYLGGHPAVRKLEETIGIAHVVTAGFPFVALGLIARHPDINVLSDNVLAGLLPVLNFGMGWLGFIIGTQLDVRFLDRLPKGTAFMVVVEALVPFAIIATACGALMLAFGMSWSHESFYRDALVLGAAGAMTAPRLSNSLSERGWSTSDNIDGLISQLDEIAGVVGLLFLAAFFRPDGLPTKWQLPGTAWVFITLGLGVSIGVLMYVMARVPRTSGEFLAVLLGFIAFGSGLASYLSLSPIVVCFIAGVLFTNFPSEQRTSLFKILEQLERPILMTFLIIAGALWSVGDWRGWVLMPCFVASRLIGKWLGMAAGKRTLLSEGAQVTSEHRDVITPLSSLSIAIVVGVQVMYSGTAIPWLMTAVIGGAIITEILVQFSAGPTQRARTAPPVTDSGDFEPRYVHPDDLQDAGQAPLPIDDHDDPDDWGPR